MTQIVRVILVIGGLAMLALSGIFCFNQNLALELWMWPDGPLSLYFIASMQAAEALKLLTGNLNAADVRLTSYEIWTHHFQRIDLGSEIMSACVVCSERRYEYLNGTPLRTITLCGRNAVQLIPGVKGDMDFAELAKSIAAFGPVQFNDFLLKCSSPPYEFTLFKDGRAIVKGTEEPGLARSVYSKFVGL